MPRRIVLAIATVLTLGGAAADAPATGVAPTATDSHLAAAVDLLDALQQKAILTHTLVDTVLPTYVEHLRKAYPTISDSTVKKFQDIFVAGLNADLDALVRAQAAVYAEHFSEAELQTVSAFYRSPAGQRFLTRDYAVAKSGDGEPSVTGVRSAYQILRDLKAIGEFEKSDVGGKFLHQSFAIAKELKLITIAGLNAAGKQEAIHAVDELKKQGEIP